MPLFLCYALWKVNAICARLERVEFECLSCWPCRTTVAALISLAMRFKSRIRTPDYWLASAKEFGECAYPTVLLSKTAWIMCQDMQNIDDLKNVQTSEFLSFCGIMRHSRASASCAVSSWFSVQVQCSAFVNIEQTNQVASDENQNVFNWKLVLLRGD